VSYDPSEIILIYSHVLGAILYYHHKSILKTVVLLDIFSGFFDEQKVKKTAFNINLLT